MSGVLPRRLLVSGHATHPARVRGGRAWRAGAAFPATAGRPAPGPDLPVETWLGLTAPAAWPTPSPSMRARRGVPGG